MSPQEIVDRWNDKYPKGTAVTLTNGVDVVTKTTTKSTAMVFARSDAVVYIHGMVGAVNLSRLTVA